MLQRLCEKAQNAVAFQMAEAVVDLLEAVHVADHHGQAGAAAFAAGQFAFQLQEERAGVRQIGEVIRGGRVFRLLILQRVLHRQRHLGADSQQDAQVIGSKRVSFRVIKRKHADHAGQTFQGNRECGSQGAELGWIVQVSGLDRRVAIDDGLLVLCDPSRKPLT